MRQVKDAGVCFGLLLAVQLAGCTFAEPPKEMGELTGKISCNGTPLKMGKIMFQSESGAPASCDIGTDGTYKLSATVGQNRVMVISKDPDPLPTGPSAEDRKNPPPAPKNYAPLKYGTPTTPLTYDVLPGSHTADFDLTD